MSKQQSKGGVRGWLDTNVTSDVASLAANGILKFVTLIFISPYKIFMPIITLLRNPLRRKYVCLVWAVLACAILVVTSVIGFFLDSFNPTPWLIAIAVNSLVVVILNGAVKPTKIKAVQVAMEYGREITQDGDYLGNITNLIKHHGKIDLNIENPEEVKDILIKDSDESVMPQQSAESSSPTESEEPAQFVQLDLDKVNEDANVLPFMEMMPIKDDAQSAHVSNSVGVFDDDDDEEEEPAQVSNVGVFDDDDDDEEL